MADLLGQIRAMRAGLDREPVDAGHLREVFGEIERPVEDHEEAARKLAEEGDDEAGEDVRVLAGPLHVASSAALLLDELGDVLRPEPTDELATTEDLETIASTCTAVACLLIHAAAEARRRAAGGAPEPPIGFDCDPAQGG